MSPWTPEQIEGMTPEQRYRAQVELVREAAFRRGWTELQDASPAHWPGKPVTVEAADLHAKTGTTHTRCHQCRRAFAVGDRVQEVATGRSGAWPRILVCFVCVDRYLDWFQRYREFDVLQSTAEGRGFLYWDEFHKSLRGAA